MNAIELSQLTALGAAIAHLLKTELTHDGTVTTIAGKVIISINRQDFENGLGNLLQKIYNMIDRKFPTRSEHLSLVIRDTDARYENVFKIWKSA